MSTKSIFLKFFKNFSLSAIVGSMLGFIFTGYLVTAQFVPPGADPPGGNVEPPINTSNTGQIKGGGLALNNNNVAIDALVAVQGYIQLAIVTGAPPAADCDAADERGRLMVDPAASAGNGDIWVCMGTGWKKR
ncbi:MAG: hypothetical protein AAB524_02375 [Patescibacteria group bacterium]